MASLSILVQGSLQENLEQMDLNATTQSVPDTGLGRVFKDAYTNAAYYNGPTYNLTNALYDYSSSNEMYTEQQLSVLHPNVPPEKWKGGARAFQAEFIADKYEFEQQRQELDNFVAGQQDPNAGVGSQLAVDTVGMAAGLIGGFVDPLVLTTFHGSSMALNALKMPLKSVSTAYMKYIGSSRLASKASNEIVMNMLSETAVMYPLHKLVLDEYTKGEETTLLGTMGNAASSALIFTGLGSVLGSAGGAALKKIRGRRDIIENIKDIPDKIKQDSFEANKDKINAHTNSDAANTAALKEAVLHTIESPFMEAPSSSSERLSKKAFNLKNTPTFDTAGSPWFGVYDAASMKADYTGQRFGDTHVFVSSPEAAQGMFDLFAKDGSVYSIYGHNGKLELIDLETTKASEYPDILDIIEDTMSSKSFIDKLSDDPTLSEVFHAANEVRNTEGGASGADLVKMFDKINAVLAEEASGTLHVEKNGDTSHTVMSVFDKFIEASHLKQVHKGTSKVETPVEEPIVIPRRDIPRTTLDGKPVPLKADVPYSHYLDGDSVFNEGFKKYQDPEYLAELNRVNENVLEDIEVDNRVKEVTADIKNSVDQMTEAASRDEKAVDINVQNIESHVELDKLVTELEKKFKENTPEKEYEFEKSVENCLRKNL